MKLTTVEVPQGDGGTQATVSMMRDLVYQGLRSPIILQWAQLVVEGRVDPDDQIGAIYDWVRDHFTYQLDPEEVQGVRVYDLISHPLALKEMYNHLGKVIGDCDDASILVAVFGKANFIPVKWRIVGFQGPQGPFAHIYPLLKGKGSWFSLDVTRPLDSSVPRITRVAEVTV